MISQRFIEAVKLHELSIFQICMESKVPPANKPLHPSTLSRIINKSENVPDNDRRVIAVSKVIGLNPKECFET